MKVHQTEGTIVFNAVNMVIVGLNVFYRVKW